MKHVTLNIPDRDYAIMEKCACVEGLTVEKLILSATKNRCDCDLELPMGDLFNTKDCRQFEEVWSPDIEEGEATG